MPHDAANSNATAHRPEVDGLRAVAVIPVLLFHAQLPWFTGGFVGVDIFFVISGYLISRIILRDVSLGRFSLVTFFERRVRRILPALYVVMAACLFPAWDLMLADNLENFGQSLAATALSANNLLIWLTSGYWGIAAEFKPLLHTWSLGVEEQFYLVYPLLLMMLFRWRRSAIPLTLVTMTLLSLLAAQWAHVYRPSAAVLLLPYRAFELLAGGMLAWHELFGRRSEGDVRRLPEWLREATCVVAIAAIGLSIVAFTSTSAVPGVAAILPVGGATALIAFARPDRGVGRWLACAPAVGIGAISYSLYLWHQPVLAFFRLTQPEPPSHWVQLGVVTLSFPLAWASWKFVETPFRSSHRFSRASVFTIAIAGMAVFAGIGFAIDRCGGFPGRVPGMAVSANGATARLPRHEYVDRMYRPGTHEFEPGAKPRLLVIGNSYARDTLNCIAECDALPDWDISYVAVPRALPLPKLTEPGVWPAALARRLKECDLLLIVQGDVPVFRSDDWPRDRAVLESLGARNILFLGTKNFGWNPNAFMALPDAKATSYRPRVEDRSVEWNRVDVATFGSGRFINLLQLLMGPDGRVSLFTEDGQLISEDGRHLTPQGARYIGKRIFAQSEWMQSIADGVASAKARSDASKSATPTG